MYQTCGKSVKRGHTAGLEDHRRPGLTSVRLLKDATPREETHTNHKMSRNAAIISILAALAVGLVLGYAVGIQRSKRASPPTRATAGNVVEVFRQAAQKDDDAARQDCLRAKLGPERYAALVLNPNAATTEDQFKILPCSGT